MLAACGGADDGSPTAEENRELENAADMLDVPSDSLVASEDTPLGNGEEAQTGELPVVNEALGNEAAMEQ